MVLTRAQEQRLSRLEVVVVDIHKTLDQKFSEFMAVLNRSRDDKLCDDQSTLDRYSPMSQKVKGSGSEGLERALDDEELVETEVETKASGIEDRAVENEANSKVISAIVKEESIPQFLMVTEADSTCVQHTNVILQQVSISPLEHSLNFCKANLDVMGNCQYAMGKTHQIWSDSNFECVKDDACQVFDVIHMRTKVLPREHKKRFHKSWRFKFKDKVQPSKLIQEQLGVHKGNATRNQLRSPSGFVVDDSHSGFGSDIWYVQYLVGSVVVEDFQETQWLFNGELKDNQIFQILIEEGSNSSAYQKFNGMRIGSHRLHHQKKLSKSPKSWKLKFKISLEDTDFAFKMDRWRKAPYVKLETESFLEIESMQEDVQLVLLAFLHVNATEPRYAIGDRDEMLEVARDVSKRSMLGLTFGIRESNAGEDQRAVCEQIIKVNVWLYQISLVLQQVMRSKKIKFPKRWMFKYKYGKEGIQRLQIQLKYKSWLGFEERFKSWKRRESWRRHKNMQLQVILNMLFVRIRPESKEVLSIVKLLFQNSLVHHQQTVNAEDERHIMVCVDKSDGQLFWMVFVRKPAIRAVQRIWEKATRDVTIIDANSVRQEEFEQVVNHTPFLVIRLEGLLLLGDESFQIKHKWRFKLLPLILECELYSDRLVLVTNYAQQFDISVFFSTNLEVKVSSKEGDLLQEKRTWAG